MTAPVPPVPDEPGPVIDLGYLSLPAELQQAIEARAAGRRAAEIDAEPSGTPDPGTDPSRALSMAQDGSRERTGAVPSLPLGAVFDRASVREIARMAIGRYWNHDPLGCDDHPAAERVTEAFWPLLEHAQQALSSNEGERLWMLDCGELVARHRERAVAAEAKLAAVRDLIRGRSLIATEHIGAIIGSEEGDSREPA